jgi:formylglycine-generating enzyme required for sulfatase activity
MRFSFLKFVSTALLICSFLSCKNQEKEAAETSEENIQQTEKSYYENYMEEIAKIQQRDSVSTSGMLQIEGGEFMMGGNS